MTQPFGLWLRSVREEAGVSLRKLARQIKRSPSYLSSVERGLHVPPPPEVQALLADALGVPRREMTLRGYEGRIDPSLQQAVRGHPNQDHLVRLLEVTKAMTRDELKTFADKATRRAS